MATLFMKRSQPVNVEAPFITPETADQEGVLLTCSDGVWVGASFLTRQWFRDSELIPGQTANTYLVTVEDSEVDLQCIVYGNGTVAAPSNVIGVGEILEPPVEPEGDLTMFQSEIDAVDPTKILTSVIDPTYVEFEFSYNGLEVKAGNQLGLEYGASKLLDAMGFRWYSPQSSFWKRPVSIPTGLTQAKTTFWFHKGFNLFLVYGHSWEGVHAASRALLNNAYAKWATLNACRVATHPAGHRWSGNIANNMDYFATQPHLIAGYPSGNPAQRDGTHYDLTVTGADYNNLVMINAAEILSVGLNAWSRAHMDASDGDANPSDLFYPFTAAVAAKVRSGTDPIGHHPAYPGVPDATLGCYAYASHRLPPTQPHQNLYVQVALAFNNAAVTGLTYLQLIQQHGDKSGEGMLLRGYFDTEVWSMSMPMTNVVTADNLEVFDDYRDAGAFGGTFEFAANWLVNLVWTRYALKKMKTGTGNYAAALAEVKADIFGGDPAIDDLYNLWSDSSQNLNNVTMLQTFQIVNSMAAGWYKTRFQQYCCIMYEYRNLPSQTKRELLWPAYVAGTNYVVGSQVMGFPSVRIEGSAVKVLTPNFRRYYRCTVDPSGPPTASTIKPSHTDPVAANELTGPDFYRWKDVSNIPQAASVRTWTEGWMKYALNAVILSQNGRYYQLVAKPAGEVPVSHMPIHMGSFDKLNGDNYTWRDVTVATLAAIDAAVDAEAAAAIEASFVPWTSTVYAPGAKVKGTTRYYVCVGQPGGSSLCPSHRPLESTIYSDGYGWEHIQDTSLPEDPFPAAVSKMLSHATAIRNNDDMHSYAFLRQQANGRLTTNYTYLNMFYGREPGFSYPNWFTNPVLPTEFAEYLGILDALIDRDPRLDSSVLTLVTDIVPNVQPSQLTDGGTGFKIVAPGNFKFVGPGTVSVKDNYDDSIVNTTYGAGIHTFTVNGRKNVGTEVTSLDGNLFLDTFPECTRDPFFGGPPQHGWFYIPGVAAGQVNIEAGVRIRFYDQNGMFNLYNKKDPLYVAPTNLGPGQIRMDNGNSRGVFFNINCNRYLSCKPNVALVPTAIAEEDGLINQEPVNLTPPVLKGPPLVDGVLALSNGTWLDSPDSTFTYKFFKNNVEIPGAIEANYTAVAGDLGAAIKGRVTATNIHGSEFEDSNEITITGTLTIIEQTAHDGTPTGLTALAGSTFTNAQPDPNGGNNAIKVTCGVGNSGFGVSNTINFWNGINYINFNIKKSVWASLAAWIRVRTLNISITDVLSLDLNTGQLGANTFDETSVVDLGDGYFAVAFQVDMTGAADLVGTISIFMGDANNDNTVNGNADHSYLLHDFRVSR